MVVGPAVAVGAGAAGSIAAVRDRAEMRERPDLIGYQGTVVEADVVEGAVEVVVVSGLQTADAGVAGQLRGPVGPVPDPRSTPSTYTAMAPRVVLRVATR